MLLVDFIKEGVAALESIYPTREAHSIVMRLCEYLLGTRNYTHIVEPDYRINDYKLDKLEQAMARLAKGEPIQYVTGEAEFCGLKFKVSPAVLIPRPETELLCREAIKVASRLYRMRIPYGKNAGPVRILDLCSGTGCISWVLALSVPSARVVGVDVDEEALKLARAQEFYPLMKEREASAPVFVQANVLDWEQEFDYGPFDLILSNPPYILESEKPNIRKNVLDYEPGTALFVSDEDPLVFYRAIAKWSRRFLVPEGFGMTEINSLLGPETEAVMREEGFSETEIIRDFYDKKRFISYKW